jgi:hypothetical protein
VSHTRLTDNIRAIWTPRDAIDTAKQFHLELDNAERGSRLMSQSRERKAKVMDALAVILLFLLMGALGAATLLLVAPKAKADIDATSVAYAAHYADAICTTLAGHPTNNGVQGILSAIRDHGLTNLQAAGAVVLAVTDVCPQQTYILERFADRWSADAEEKVV